MSARARSVWFVLGGIVSVQVGAAFAKHLFDVVAPTTMVWLRLGFSALVLLAIARPRVTHRSRRDWLTVLAFGLTLATMNWSIYQSFSRIPLGIAVTIEFLGPLSVALAGSRRLLDLVWVALAGGGVAALGLGSGSVTPAGVLLALLAAAAWAVYIRLGVVTGRRWPGLDGLALASGVGAVVLTPFGVARADPEAWQASTLAVALTVGLLSSVVPYSLEINALRTIPPRTFGILMSLEPAAAALVALVILGEQLNVVDWLAIAAVVVASVGATREAPPEPVPANPA